MCYSFEDHLIFLGMVEAKLICDFFILLTIGLHVEGFAFVVVARVLADIFSSTLRIMSLKARCRLVINRDALIVRLNHCVLGQLLDEHLPHPQASS